ncbi:hypothetical protein GCK32_001041 [Trichostrongylus colubriformis]|uniref:Uncharacterized protein n=1 Tax=Trichostrongylus colubriformis TaxID=6319 RepID=A0AAN8F5Z2_TRICO
MATMPLRSSLVPVKRSRIDLSPQACGMDQGLKDLISDAGLPAYAKLLIELLMDMKRNFTDLAVQCKEIMAENKALKEENVSLKGS